MSGPVHTWPALNRLDVRRRARPCGGVATEDDVRRACRALPGVSERVSWGRPAWFARTLVARMWDADVVTVKTAERDALGGSDPETLFWTPHHDRSPQLVLVRLPRVREDELAELLEDSYRIASRSRDR